MEYRPYYLSCEWVRQGHSVTIAASSASHVRRITPETKGWLTQENIDGIKYLWFKTPGYSGNGNARAINIFSFIGQLLAHGNWIAQNIKPDVVIASSTYPLDIIAASAITMKSNAKLVFEVHDLWPLSPIELGGMSRKHPFIVLMQWAENFAYRHADKVISMLPKTMEHMIQHGMKPDKFVYIPNGINVAEWQDVARQLPDEHNDVFEELKQLGNFLVGYTGAHGLANVLENFIDAAYMLQKAPVTFILVGQGPERESIIKRALARRQTNVIFLPTVEKKMIPAVLEKMDALYIGLKGDPLFRFGVSPNKLIDYMMAGKPVIYAIQSGNDMVAESGCGISIQPEKPQEIVQAVLDLMQLSQEERKGMGQKGKEYVLANHDYRVLAKQFLASLEA